MKRILLCVFVITSIFIFRTNSHSYNSEITPVYQAVIEKLAQNEGESIALTDSAVKPHLGGQKLDATVIRKIIPGLPVDLGNDFVKNYNKTVRLKKYIKDSKKVTWITETKFTNITSSINPDREMENFFDSYPDLKGIHSFTNIGFNRENTKAFLLISFYCGARCGNGNCFILEKRNDNWRVVYSKKLWGQ